jgi:hypothetical protein
MNRATRIVTQIAVATAVMVAPMLVAATANAGPYDTSPIKVSTSQPAPGGQVHITASGFKPNSTAKIYIHSNPILLATTTADANGIVDITVTVPTTLAAGTSHEIQAQGVDPAGNPLTDTINITLAGGSALPFTGVDALGAGAAGAGLIGFGAFLVFAARRKRAARAS